MNRAQILIKLLKDKPKDICAEVGVFWGDTTIKLLKAFPEIKQYYAIDMWKMYDDYAKTLRPKRRKKDHDKIYNHFKDIIIPYNNRCTIIRKPSKEASKEILDRSLDFVFIDANHSYKYVKQDIILWKPKIKTGGILSGHDFNNSRFGVDKAVQELIPNVEHEDHVWWITIK